MNETAPNLYLRRLVHAICFGGASTLTLSTLAAPGTAAAADATDNGDLNEIVVTGIRASLQQSLDIKREATGIVDAISAEDIGKFPDSNLATAMERIPGVSVSRGTAAMGGVPTSIGDATEITVRGFGPSFNETLFDGRQVPTALGNSTRGFDFSSVSSDFVGEVDVLKTPDATLSSGAIGATINIKFPKPFDHPGLQIVGSAAGTDSTGENKVTPNASLLLSDTFADDRFGVLVDGSYTDRKVQGNHVNIQGWEGNQIAPSQLAGAAPGASTTPSIKDWFIQDYGIYQEHTDDKRVDGRIALQARPVDGLVFTLDDNYSEDTLTQTQYGYSVWFNNGSLTDVTQAPDGTLTSFVQHNTPTDFQSQVNGSVIQNNQAGLNVKWDTGEHTSYLFDASTAFSKLNPGGQLTSIDSDVGYGPSGSNGGCLAGLGSPKCNGNNIGISGVGSGSLPYPTGYGPNGNEALFINNGIIGSHVLPMESQQNKDTINQFKLEGDWADQQLKLKYGVQVTHDEEDLSEFDSFTNNDWQAYAGYGPASDNSGGVALPQSFFTNSFGTSSFINGYSNNGKLPPNILAFNAYQVLGYLESLGNPQTKNIPGANKTCCTPPFNGIYQMAANPGDTQEITENTVSPYLNLTTTAQLADRPLKINMGLRYEVTHVDSQGLSQLPTSLTIQSSDHTAFLVAYSGETTIDTKSSYRYLLPNLDLTYELTDQVQLRFDASRTLTRAPLSDMTPDLVVAQGQRVGSLVATGGNPTLLPYLSDNLDLGAAWYYARNSYMSAGLFLKDVTNFIVNGTSPQTINGVIDPTTGKLAQFAVTSHINGPSAEVRGIEVTLQHMFWDTGFGFQVNGTYVNTDQPYNPNDTSVSGFAVTGLANSANFIPFYQKYGFEARVAVNWRSSYLDHFGQQQNNSQYGTEPTFVNAATYVDFSTSYQIDRNIQVYFEALNLTDQVYSTHGRFAEQLLDVVDTGRAFTLGVHLKF
jgi:iron complex outermembrane receptor protein